MTDMALSETQSVSCENFEGVSVDYADGKPDLSRDVYSGLTITIKTMILTKQQSSTQD
tara:strand:- start:17 stop:190 length:174 start_codon:yes stop_codon:yes gene_type:complete